MSCADACDARKQGVKRRLKGYSYWETDISSAGRVFQPSLLWKRNVHYRVHNSPLIIPILSQKTAVQSYTVPLRFVLISSSHLYLCFSSSLFTFRFSIWKFVSFIQSVSAEFCLPRPCHPAHITLPSQSVATHAPQTCGRTGPISINDFSVCASLSQAGEVKKAIRIRSPRFVKRVVICCQGCGCGGVRVFEGTVRATKLQHLSKNRQRPNVTWSAFCQQLHETNCLQQD